MLPLKLVECIIDLASRYSLHVLCIRTLLVLKGTCRRFAGVVHSLWRPLCNRHNVWKQQPFAEHKQHAMAQSELYKCVFLVYSAVRIKEEKTWEAWLVRGGRPFYVGL